MASTDGQTTYHQWTNRRLMTENIAKATVRQWESKFRELAEYAVKECQLDKNSFVLFKYIAFNCASGDSCTLLAYLACSTLSLSIHFAR